ncbi:MAG: hypothetical protein HRT35_14190 [Algicola sp.]|nr:hypothetical protein [Algicola sp.]
MFTYGLAMISALICALLCLISTAISMVRYDSDVVKHVKLNRFFIYSGLVLTIIIFLLTIVLVISRPDYLSSQFGALTRPLTIALLPLMIAVYANIQVSRRNTKLDVDG